MDNRFEYRIEERGRLLLIWLTGSLDIETVSEMKADVDIRLATEQRRVLLDFGELKHIDSAGIGALITIFKRVQPNKGEMKISRLTGQPREIFKLLRLDRVFQLYEDFDEAVKSFQ